MECLRNYTCSPSKDNGFETEFLDFTIEHT